MTTFPPTTKRLLLAGLILTGLVGPLHAAPLSAPCEEQSVNNPQCEPVNAAHPLHVTGAVTTTTAPAKGTGAYAAATITNSSTLALAASTAVVFLDIVNESATATIACNFGGTAVINGAGSITIPPNWHRSWEGSFIPTDALNCISSVASSAASIGAK
jgi:hypothetical protein